jgi:DNA-binding XRE family transcriptional regulator
MSTNSALPARFGRLGPDLAEYPVLSSSDPLVSLILKRVGPLDQPITVARRLRCEGVTLRVAHDVITRLAEVSRATCEVGEATDITRLAADLAPLNVIVQRRRPVGEPAAFIAEIRARHGLSQREFADRLGLDVRTLQNWEQGRNRPDAAVLTLVMLFDRHPDLVEQATFEDVAAP